jgi:hypothetical protein
MSTLVEQLLKTEAHQSIFESAVRQNPLPVCAAFGSSSNPQPVSFSNTERVLSTKDSDAVRAQFPQSVAASGNVVLTSAGASSAGCSGKRVAVLFSGGPAAGGHNVVCGLKRVLGAGNTLFGVKAGPRACSRARCSRSPTPTSTSSSTPVASTSSARTAPRSRATSSSRRSARPASSTTRRDRRRRR